MLNLLVAIKGCEKHYDRFLTQRKTWATDYALVGFFTGNILGCAEDYAALPSKTQAICRHALALGHDFVFLPDSDTYVSLERLLASDFAIYDYVGYASPTGYAFGGPGYWLSNYAMQHVAEAPCRTGFEDQWVGETLAKAGIALHHDPRYSIQTFVLPENDVISCHLGHLGGYLPEFMTAAHRRFLGLL